MTIGMVKESLHKGNIITQHDQTTSLIAGGITLLQKYVTRVTISFFFFFYSEFSLVYTEKNKYTRGRLEIDIKLKNKKCKLAILTT